MSSSSNMAMYKRPPMRTWKFGSCILPPPGRVMGDSFLAKIMNSIRDPPAPKVWRREFVPVADIDGYLRALKGSGTSPEELERIRERHERYIPPPPTPKYVYKPETTPEMPVKTKLKVKGGKVKLSVCVPYDQVLDCTRNGQKVPFEVMIKCMKMNGASDEFLIDQINKHDKMLKNKKKDDEKLDKIFDKYSTKKTKPLKAVKKMDPIF